MDGKIVLILFAAMSGSWLFRFLLLRVLRVRHPAEFAALGAPSSRQLESMLPRHHEMHLGFWKYLWEGRVFSLGDRLASALALATLLSDTVFVIAVVLLFWAAGK